MMARRREQALTRALLVIIVGSMVLSLATPLVAGQDVDASLSDESPTAEPDEELIVNAPLQLSVTVETTGEVEVIMRDERNRVIHSEVVDSNDWVSTMWEPERGVRGYHVVVRDMDGRILDATSEHELVVTERDPEATCLEFDVEMHRQNFVCAVVGTFTGALPLAVVGMIVWGGLSLGLFIRTGSPMIPYILLLLTGGAVSSTVAGPAIALMTVFALAVTGAIPLLLYIKYSR